MQQAEYVIPAQECVEATLLALCGERTCGIQLWCTGRTAAGAPPPLRLHKAEDKGGSAMG